MPGNGTVAMYLSLKIRPQDKSAYQKIIFSYFSTKTYVVGTQKNGLDETILLSTLLNWPYENFQNDDLHPSSLHI